MKNIALAAEYRRIIRVKRIGLFYRVCNDPSVTVLDGGHIFPICVLLLVLSCLVIVVGWQCVLL